MSKKKYTDDIDDLEPGSGAAAPAVTATPPKTPPPIVGGIPGRFGSWAGTPSAPPPPSNQTIGIPGRFGSWGGAPAPPQPQQQFVQPPAPTVSPVLTEEQRRANIRRAAGLPPLPQQQPGMDPAILAQSQGIPLGVNRFGQAVYQESIPSGMPETGQTPLMAYRQRLATPIPAPEGIQPFGEYQAFNDPTDGMAIQPGQMVKFGDTVYRNDPQFGQYTAMVPDFETGDWIERDEAIGRAAKEDINIKREWDGLQTQERTIRKMQGDGINEEQELDLLRQVEREKNNLAKGMSSRKPLSAQQRYAENRVQVEDGSTWMEMPDGDWKKISEPSNQVPVAEAFAANTFTDQHGRVYSRTKDGFKEISKPVEDEEQKRRTEKAKTDKAKIDIIRGLMKDMAKKDTDGEIIPADPKAVAAAYKAMMEVVKEVDGQEEGGDGAQTQPEQGGEITQADLEFTAQKHGITVDEVKRRLGIK